MGRFDSSQRLAQRLIDLNGEVATLTVFATTTPDPAKPWLPGESTPTQVPARLLFLNYGPSTMYAPDSDIHRGDKKVLVAAQGLAADPNLQGTVTRVDGSVYRIVSIKQLDPSGQKIMYELQVRK